MIPLTDLPRNLFFTGKGGVGKTTIACNTAIRLADAGRRVLLVSTDPASNLDEVLETHLTNRPTAIDRVPNLFALNLSPQQAAAEYRERMVGPYRNLLPQSAIEQMEEQFSGSCTVEIAAFDQFANLLGHPNALRDFDHVLFDTAPTGHTLRLLTLPSAWVGFMDSSTSGISCIGPLSGLAEQQALYRTTLGALSTPSQTLFVLVTRPETSALQEADRTCSELSALDINNQLLVINGVVATSSENDPIAIAMKRRCDRALDDMPVRIGQLQQVLVSLTVGDLAGIDGIRELGVVPSATTDANSATLSREACNATLPLNQLCSELSVKGRGVVMTMGKGGVGKTTIAAAIAVSLARAGHPVRLTTTDPAAHLQATLAEDSLNNLIVERIDPALELANYRREVMESAGQSLDAAGLALLEEDLRSPCTEEVAVFRAFARAVACGEDSIVVVDTAPTGHTVLLLDATLSYHREVSRQQAEIPESVRSLLPRLRDPDYCKVVIVTLAEATPVHEAAELQRDLRRAGIEPAAWVINQSLTPYHLTDPTLFAKQTREQRFVQKVVQYHSTRTAIVAWQTEPPIGIQRLSRLL